MMSWREQWRVRSIGAVCLVALSATPALAHHSSAMFDASKTLDLTGTVREVQWTNPHCFIQLLVPDKNAKEVEWSVEMAAPAQLRRAGWKPTTLKPGDKVTVKIRPLRNDAPGGNFMMLTFGNGETLK